MRLLTILLLFSMLATGCAPDGSESSKDQESQLKMYTSIYPLQYFAKRIGGERIEVESVIPPGTDGHTYEPTTKELIQIAESDMMIYNGAGFEGFIEKAKKSLKKQDVIFLSASKDLSIEGDKSSEENHEADHEDDEHQHGGVNPHFWLDPVSAIQMAETIKEAMIKQRPEWKTEFETNYASLKKDLEDLDHQFMQVADNAKRKDFIVAHSAYGKWEERYGLKQISIAGLSPSHEPSQKEAQGIIDYARNHHISYILFEKNITPGIAKMIQKEVGADVLYLSNLESLTEDQYRNNEDYISIMKENIKTLKIVLN